MSRFHLDPESPRPRLRLLITAAPEVGDYSCGDASKVPLEDADLGEMLERLAVEREHGDVEATVVLNLETARLRRELRALPPRERLTLYLAYGIDCSPQTRASIATRLGVTPRTVHRIERRAMELLRRRYHWRPREVA